MGQPLVAKGKISLDDFNPRFHEGLDRKETKRKTRALCKQIGALQKLLYANSTHSLILLFQGMDASGKDGAVRHVLEFVNPAGVEATSFKEPSAEELAHDFLWRVHKAVPRHGRIGIWNRSQYEEVLIVRVLGILPKAEWEPRYEQINAFEEYLTSNKTVVVKFFLHLSKEEQAARFRRRLEIPSHRWKFSPADLKMRERWDDFQEAYEAVLTKCSSKWARWHIVPADHKWYRNFVVAKATLAALESLEMKWPEPKEDLSAVKIE